VRRGETLTGLARRYQVTVRALARANTLSPTYELRTGMRLRIPG
jgi:LysM repeat protein